jgi:threonylcarbamoyladenosine tRNA methylthiotransferase MtaB
MAFNMERGNGFMNKPSFNIINFGCRTTQADGAALEQAFLQHSLPKAGDWQNSDVVVINTCTVTQSADAQARQMIRRVRRINPKARIVVTGCYAQREPAKLAAMTEVDYVVGNSHKEQLVELVLEKPAAPLHTPDKTEASIYCSDIFNQKQWQPSASVGGADKTRPVLKIQDGCNQRCSYCVIPFVRGNSRSLDLKEVEWQVNNLLGQGYQEIVLTGIHLGAYGSDHILPTNLASLVRRLIPNSQLKRLRLSSIEPMELTDELIDLAASSPKIARHFHIPLQSGSDRILRLMRRPYRSLDYSEIVNRIAKQIPGAAIGADVMVGFPSESDGDFESTRQLLASIPITYLHVFPFSPRPGTAALEIRPNVPGPVQQARGEVLRKLGEQKSECFRAGQMNQRLTVLTLGEIPEGNSTEALSDNYLKVEVPGHWDSNRLLKVRITSEVPDGVKGMVIGG